VWFETDYDARRVTAHITAAAGNDSPALSLSVYADSQPILHRTASFHNSSRTALSFTIPEEHFHSWSPESPFLYPVTITLGKDTVQSYFAMRIFTIEHRPLQTGPQKQPPYAKQQIPGFGKCPYANVKDKADPKASLVPVFCLNHKPCFLMGALDQGYWPDGLYTAPSDEALIYDITVMKFLGYNMLRKHIKVENARWYYHCDRLGMIVCQDMVNGGSRYHMPVISYLPTLFPSLAAHLKDSHYALLSRKDKRARKQWEKECMETVSHLKFFPSIAIWVPFNEGWGQFDTARITRMIKKKDPDRLIDSASGWFDQNCGDFISVHNYFRPLTVPVKKWADRAFFLSEYGGFACHVKGHSSVERVFGYKRFETIKGFQRAYRSLIQKSLHPLKKQGLSAAVFTQVSDVEEEVNGILTYDRKVNKLASRT
jgi:beta-galactosidase/beta-glucuronidase